MTSLEKYILSAYISLIIAQLSIILAHIASSNLTEIMWLVNAALFGVHLAFSLFQAFKEM